MLSVILFFACSSKEFGNKSEEIEGVIQFSVQHKWSALSYTSYLSLCTELDRWRSLFYKLSLIGQDPDRYQGAGFGNVSIRIPPFSKARGYRSFLITGSQTGKHRKLNRTQYTVVHSYSLHHTSVVSQGLTLPSSESMTHGALYDLGTHIKVVFHVHCLISLRGLT